jgi:hypothetical protein
LDSEDALTPEENYLSGTSIHLHFNFEPAYEELLPLYIYSESATFRVNILYKGAASEVQSVEIL